MAFLAHNYSQLQKILGKESPKKVEAVKDDTDNIQSKMQKVIDDLRGDKDDSKTEKADADNRPEEKPADTSVDDTKNKAEVKKA